MARKDANPGKSEEAALRREKALKMRIGGMSYRAIGAQLGVSHVQAENDVARELAAQRADVPADVAKLRAIEDARLDAAQRALLPRIQTGDTDAIGKWIRLSESRRKLWGLDAPVITELRGNAEHPVTTRQQPPDLSSLSDSDLQILGEILAKTQGVPPP